MRQIADLPDLDFNSADYVAAPFATLAAHGQKWPLARSARGVEILDYDLCRKAVLDRQLGTGHPKLMNVLGLPEGRPLNYKRQSISFHNRGPRRRDLRLPLARLMGPEGTETFRREVDGVVQRVIEAIPKGEPTDLIETLCDPTPSAVYCYWMGAPFEDAAFVARTSHSVQKVHTRNPEFAEEIINAFEALIDFAEARIAACRAAPGDNLLTDLIKAEEAGQLDEDDLRNWVIKLAEANTDNSSHQIGIAVIELASRPEVWARLGRDPSLVPAAVREVMRYHPRTISTSREAMEDMVIADVAIPKGTPVFANIGATHWDERYYAEPETFDIDRTDEPPHLNFGGGIFSCIGRYAVTMEVEQVISHLATRYPNLAVEDHGFTHSPMFTSVSRLVARLQ
ncbi:cytochrome P450 [Rhodobacteraceae bacterium N5(2021)]|uniref:Cytochrome P450 n=1 Tax=Gymnodinialimonas phycosphaerae TaxID=2841589 RepID=A0A975TV21_9RHOB|nr:cytochrome P450 [Gymnodinialimonas phycosphaerae]MBY4895118.1 cytochrome P450 [Gymnodinialimonas phycosphaerae]